MAHNLADRKSVPNNNELTGVNFNSNIMLLNATPNAHDILTLTISEVGSINHSHCITFTGMPNIYDKNMDPYKLLKSIKVSNINHLIIGQLDINSLRNKIEADYEWKSQQKWMKHSQKSNFVSMVINHHSD